MEQTVIMSLDEYNELQKKVEEAERIRKECEKNCEERGYLVRKYNLITDYDTLFGRIGSRHEVAEVEIKSAQETTHDLLMQISKWKDCFEEACRENEKLQQKIKDIYHRKLWKRIINEGA